MAQARLLVALVACCGDLRKKDAYFVTKNNAGCLLVYNTSTDLGLFHTPQEHVNAVLNISLVPKCVYEYVFQDQAERLSSTHTHRPNR